MNLKLMCAVIAALVLTGCSSQPEYTGRKTVPFTKDYLKGKPKKMEWVYYSSLEDYKKHKPTTTQVVDLDEGGYAIKMLVDNNDSHSETLYEYFPEYPEKQKSIKTTITSSSEPEKEVRVKTYYVDDKGNYTKIVSSQDGVPHMETIYEYDSDGYPVTSYLYQADKSKDDFQSKVVYKYKDGLCVKCEEYLYGGKNPTYITDVIDDGIYEGQKDVYREYFLKGELKQCTRWSYDNMGNEVLQEVSEDGKNWVTRSEKTYNELGDLVKSKYIDDPVMNVKEWKYTYDGHGNWITMTDGNVMYTREIQYYE